MGQTQILFIVLSVIIVGIAVAVGITQFGSNAVQANKNAVLLDCNDIASKAQNWYRSPGTMGGGQSSFDGSTFEGGAPIDFDKLSLTDKDGSASTYTNANGVYTISGIQAGQFHLRGAGTEQDAQGRHVTVEMDVTPQGPTGVTTVP